MCDTTFCAATGETAIVEKLSAPGSSQAVASLAVPTTSRTAYFATFAASASVMSKPVPTVGAPLANETVGPVESTLKVAFAMLPWLPDAS